MKYPMISVIIPIYNGENFIKMAIESIYRQMQPWIEIILINDGSFDRTEQICKKYIYDNIIYKSIENSGAGHARNIGISIAKGNWVLFLDSDDLIWDGFFNNSLYLFLTECLEAKTDIICMPMTYCDMNLFKKPRIVYPQPIDKISHYMPELEFTSCLYRRNFLKEKKVYFFEYRKQDIESAFRFRAFSNTKNIRVDNSRVFYIYRENFASNTHTWNLGNYYEIKALVYHQLFEEFDKPDPDTDVWLYIQYLFHTKELFTKCLRNDGKPIEPVQVKTVFDKISKSKKVVPVSLMPMNYKIFYYFVKLLNTTVGWKLCVMIFKKKYMVVAEKNRHTQKNDNILNSMDCIFSQMKHHQKFVSEQIKAHNFTYKHT